MRHKLLAAVLLGCLIAAAPVFAHHSFAAEYDVNKPTTKTGVLTKVEWMNPHVVLYIDVKGEDGEVHNWRCDGYPPNTLINGGLAKYKLIVGDTVTVTGWLAREAPNNFSGREIRMPDGGKYFVGPAAS